MPSFVPVVDVEQPRSERDDNSESMAAHRSFDAPFQLNSERGSLQQITQVKQKQGTFVKNDQGKWVRAKPKGQALIGGGKPKGKRVRNEFGEWVSTDDTKTPHTNIGDRKEQMRRSGSRDRGDRRRRSQSRTRGRGESSRDRSNMDQHSGGGGIGKLTAFLRSRSVRMQDWSEALLEDWKVMPQQMREEITTRFAQATEMELDVTRSFPHEWIFTGIVNGEQRSIEWTAPSRSRDRRDDRRRRSRSGDRGGSRRRSRSRSRDRRDSRR
jgi:hypothetical protein